MFTGIIESLGDVKAITPKNNNIHFTIESNITEQLKIDQSVSHNGVCLTVVGINNKTYTVTAIKETLDKTNLSSLKTNDSVNLERAMKLGDRLDGHIVQGHVDQTGTCTDVLEMDGSWVFSFEYDPNLKNITIEKGSITVNGVSLTVVNSGTNTFSVAIIPYTFNHTGFQFLRKGDTVNLEFDVLGKYISKMRLLNY